MEAEEASGRLDLLASILLFALSSAGVAAKIVFDVRSIFEARVQRTIATVAVSVTAAGFAIVVVTGLIGVWPESITLVGRDLYEQAVAKVASFSDGTGWGATALSSVIWTYAAAASIVSFVAAIGMISCLAHPVEVQSVSHNDEKDRDDWSWQLERLRTYLFLSTAALAIGVIALRMWVIYPSFLFGEADKALLAAYTSAANSYAVYEGILYSICIASIAFPVTWILSSRADRIAARMLARSSPTSSTEPTELGFSLPVHLKKAQEKMIITPVEALKLILAVLAPLLAGTLSSLTGLLS